LPGLDGEAAVQLFEDGLVFLDLDLQSTYLLLCVADDAEPDLLALDHFVEFLSLLQQHVLVHLDQFQLTRGRDLIVSLEFLSLLERHVFH